MSHRSPPVGSCGKPWLSYMAQIPCDLWECVILCGLLFLYMNLMLLYVGWVVRYVTLLLRYVNWQFRFVHLSLRYVGLLFAYAGLILHYLIYSLHFVHFPIPSMDISSRYVTMADTTYVGKARLRDMKNLYIMWVCNYGKWLCYYVMWVWYYVMWLFIKLCEVVFTVM